MVQRDSKNEKAYARIKEFFITTDFIDEIKQKSGNLPDSEKSKFITVNELKQGIKYLASWDIVELAYDIDNKSMKFIKKKMPKLNDGHIHKKKIRKMRFNLAAEIPSRTTAAFILLLLCVKGLLIF